MSYMNEGKNGFDYSPKAFGETKKRMCELRTKESINEFYEVFAWLVKEGEWISAPVNNQQLVISSFRGGNYIAVYSSMDNRVAGDSKDVITTDINKFIDVLYANPRLLGIVVDPNKDPFLINRKAIHELTIRKDPRIVVKDWGKGVPLYTEKDLMVLEELLDFGMQVVEDYYVKKQGFSILEKNYGVSCFPNFALKKGGKVYLVAVDVAVGKRPTYSEREKSYYISACERFNAKCLYAPVAINSSDEIRASKKLALYGDEYCIDFDGVEELN